MRLTLLTFLITLGGSVFEFIPVNPSLDDHGRLRALVPILGPEDSTPVPLEDFDPAQLDTDFEMFRGSLELNAKLQAGSIFSASGGYYQHSLVQKFLFGQKQISPGSDHGLLGTFWGVGLQILLRAEGTDLSGSLDLASMAASVELNRASVHFEVRAHGLGLESFATVLENVPVSGKLDLEAYAELRAGIQDIQATAIDNLTEEMLLPIAVLPSEPLELQSVLAEAGHVRQAIMRISWGSNLQQALESVPQGVSESVVRSTYDEFCDDVSSPSDVEQQEAKQWINQGAT